MPARKISFVVSKSQAGTRLDRVVPADAAALGVDVSRRAARRLIDAGAVYVGGKRTRVASRAVRAGDVIDVWVDAASPDPGASEVPDLEPERILFEDEHLVAVDKPSGLPTQATPTDAHRNLLAATARRLATGSGTSGGELFPVHRLDAGTSGVVVFARNRAAAAELSRVLSRAAERAQGGTTTASMEVEKVYRALSLETLGVTEDLRREGASRFVDLALVRDGRRMAVTGLDGAAGGGGAKPARTQVRVLDRLGADDRRIVDIEARPATGRKHQVRVHLAALGLPVLGDRLYGPGDEAGGGAPRLMLHAASLRIPHPADGTVLEITSRLPEEFVGLGARASG